MIRMQRERRIGTLVVDSKPLQDADRNIDEIQNQVRQLLLDRHIIE